jgi:hypothetical protein
MGSNILGRGSYVQRSSTLFIGKDSFKKDLWTPRYGHKKV